MPNTPIFQLAANDDWLKANPDLAKAFLRATRKSIEYAVANPDEGTKVFLDTFSNAYEASFITQQWKDTIPLFGAMSPDLMVSNEADWVALLDALKKFRSGGGAACAVGLLHQPVYHASRPGLRHGSAATRRLTPAWVYKPGPDVSDTPPPGLVRAQAIAKQAAAAGLAAARPGASEKEIELAACARMIEEGVERVWTITNVGLGENAKICFPTHPPTDLKAQANAMS